MHNVAASSASANDNPSRSPSSGSGSATGPVMTNLTIGVLALQGAFVEHIALLRQAAADLQLQAASAAAAAASQTNQPAHSSDSSSQPPSSSPPLPLSHLTFTFPEIRNPADLAHCDALIIPGGESTSISLIATRTHLLEPLRHFVKIARKPVWGTCAGLILLAEQANHSKATGQELIGGLDVRVQRNYFGRQVESFEAEVGLGLLGKGEEGLFRTVFIRAPVVERVLGAGEGGESQSSTSNAGGAAVESSAGGAGGMVGKEIVQAPAMQATKAPVEILGRLPGRARALKDQTATAEGLGEEGDIVAVRQGNVFGTAFHPELTGDARIHRWWLEEVVRAVMEGSA
ncbi:hypothetical protein B0A50_07859 [Salinomyces thailandicus]|uniref:glutaminase n=1 Tax=Salinomyces thailandicus TaxID=706561 RepID=A0A4U0TLP4_9PEZI|nr:hypothetical protein B0A50_07859 [Salinomyces thailandica]